MNILIPTRRAKNTEDNMIPMINIVFLLLIFFMIAGQITTIQDQNIVLPKVVSGVPVIEQKITLQLTDSNQIFINGLPVLLDELNSELDTFSADETSISLQVDNRVKAGELDKILTILRARDVIKVTLYAEQKEHN